MNTFETDILILGSGAAGLSAAYAALEHNLKTTIVCRGEHTDCMTWADQTFEIAGGGGCGLAAPLRAEDSPGAYFKDIIAASEGRANPALTKRFVEESAPAIEKMFKMGLELETDETGKLKTVAEFRHSVPRLVYSKQGTGQSINRLFWRNIHSKLIKIPGRAVRIITNDEGVCGCLILNGPDQQYCMIKTKSIVLATGGGCAAFKTSSNPHALNGDGVVLAKNAGAELTGMDLVSSIPMSSGAYRGIGFIPQLLLSGDSLTVPKVLSSDSFTWKLDPEKMTEREMAYLFPKTWNRLNARGFDFSTQSISFEWIPHYMCGGVKIDEHSSTTVPGLFAAGEIAGGVFGKDRLPGTGITHGLIFGEIAGHSAARFAGNRPDSWLKRRLPAPAIRSLSSERLGELQIRSKLAAESARGIHRSENLADIETSFETVLEQKNQLDQELNIPSDSFTPLSEQAPFYFTVRNSILFLSIYIQEKIRRRKAYEPVADFTH